MSSCLQSAHTTVVLQFIRLYIENDWDMKWGPECKASATSALIQNRPNVSKEKNGKAKMKKIEEVLFAKCGFNFEQGPFLAPLLFLGKHFSYSHLFKC